MPTNTRDDDGILKGILKKGTTYSIDAARHRLNEAEHFSSEHCAPRPAGSSVKLIVVHSISLPAGDYYTDYVCQLFLGRLDCAAHDSFESLRDIRVSAHLFIRRNAEILQFVPFNLAAWHAGESSYKGQENCNDFSIGIELEGSPQDEYTQSQYECLAGVSNCLIAHYPTLSRQDLVGHNQIAPRRKDDPWNINWNKLKELMDSKN